MSKVGLEDFSKGRFNEAKVLYKDSVYKPDIIISVIPKKPSHDDQSCNKETTRYGEERWILDLIKDYFPGFAFHEVFGYRV